MKLSDLKTLVRSGWVSVISTSDLEAGKTSLDESIAFYQAQKPLLDFQAKELDLLLRILSDIQLELDSRNPFLQPWHQ